jgi:hypothetical protein
MYQYDQVAVDSTLECESDETLSLELNDLIIEELENRLELLEAIGGCCSL